MSTLAEYFSNHFSLSFAHNIALKQEVFKIRYKVYCEELKYEPNDKFPDGMETDAYDVRSLHFLLLHKPSQTYIGCVRAVLANADFKNECFPFEKICSSLSIDFQTKERENFGEVSRLAVIDKFRKRINDARTPSGVSYIESNYPNQEEEERRKYQNMPLIPISLYLACTTIGESYNLDSFNLMEPRLARHLRRYGFPSHQIGDFVEFHGKRGPFLIHTEEILRCFPPEVRELFTVIQEQLAPYRAQIEASNLLNKSVLLRDLQENTPQQLTWVNSNIPLS
jgi:N-acyl amino acid synthase of PEP-CTERM/exosortase system